MKKHRAWMLIACIVPMLLIFVLPAIGINGNVLLLPLMVLCCLSHFLMMGMDIGGRDYA